MFSKTAEGYLFEEFIYCYCGCQKTRPKYDIQGRERKYLNNHDKKMLNPPTKKERFAAYYAKERERLCKKSRDWNKNNKERRNKRNRERNGRNREKLREWHRQYYKNNPEIFAKYREKNRDKTKLYAQKRYNQYKPRLLLERKKKRFMLRERLFHILGHVCARCGYYDKRALQFDHLNGGGRKEQLSHRKGDKDNYYRKYINDPELARKTLQVLCSNCNWLKIFENGERANKTSVI